LPEGSARLLANLEIRQHSVARHLLVSSSRIARFAVSMLLQEVADKNGGAALAISHLQESSTHHESRQHDPVDGTGPKCALSNPL
jgi:hypothetical protein